MDIVQLFATEVLTLPRERNEDDYEKFIETWFDEYLAAISNLNANDWATEAVKAASDVLADVCRRIRSVLGHYFDGSPAAAYNALNEALNLLLPWIQKLGTGADVSPYLGCLYRIRIGSLADYTRSDLFHIPFEKRHLISPQRYSILGSPSLYLGGSVWVCWEEMGRPAFENVQVSRFQAISGSGVRVLDFAYRPAIMSLIANLMRNDLRTASQNAEFVVSYAICWPLLAACSVRARSPGSPFVPEYAIPQLLLQWIRAGCHFDGLRYFSTRIAHHANGDDPAAIRAAAGAAANYVFPTQKRQPTGHCKKLLSQFRLSTPMAWPIVQNMMDDEAPASIQPTWRLRLNEDAHVLYWKTSFYRVERRISVLPCFPV